MPENLLKGVIYRRVSTEEQVQNFSLETQLDYCKSRAKRDNAEIVEVFTDDGYPATSLNRPALSRMRAFLEKNKGLINAVYIYNVERLSRVTIDYLFLKNEFARLGVRIISATEEFGDTPEGEWNETVQAANAQLDNKKRSRRSRDGMRKSLEAGLTPWPAPLGYRNENKIGVPKEPEWSIIRRSFQEMLKGKCQQADFTKLLNRYGLRTRHSGKRLTPQQGVKILKNPYYAGYLRVKEWNNEIFVGRHKAMLPKEDFDTIQDIASGKKTVYAPRSRSNPEFPLRQDVYCGTCGRKLSGGFSRGKTKRYPYYLCPQCRRPSVPRKELHREFLDLIVGIKPDPVGTKLFRLVMEDHLKLQNRQKVENLGMLREKVEKLDSKRQKIIDGWLEGVLEEGIYKEQLDKVEAELREVRNEVVLNSVGEGSLSKTLDNAAEFFEHCDLAWLKGDIGTRQRVQEAIFPNGLVYQYTGFRTPEISLPFKVINESRGEKELMVSRQGFEP